MARSTTAPAPAWCRSDIERCAWEVGVEVAARHADDVDRDARFPAEAAEAMRAAGLYAALIPTEFGGGGAPLAEVAGAVRALAHHCSAAALVLAMHQIEVWYLVRFGTTDGLRDVMRSVSSDGWLIANANSEVGLGGDVGRSFCAVEPTAEGTGFHLEKKTLAISYGADCDGLVLNARRDPDAPETEQVLVMLRPGRFALEATSTWDTIGLRGTCSQGYAVVADEDADMVFPTPWRTIATQSVGASVILLSSTWLGIAEAAAATAHRYVRADARRKIGTIPASAPLLAELSMRLGQARATWEATVAAHRAAIAADDLESPSLVLQVRNLKLTETTSAIGIVTMASQICGLMGYKRDSEFSLDRNLRDVVGGPLMANNFRAAGDNAQLLLAMKSF